MIFLTMPLCQDSTIVETNIHYPTNNALVWDCIKESHRLLSQLAEEVKDLNYRDYTKNAKRTFFKINVVGFPKIRPMVIRV